MLSTLKSFAILIGLALAALLACHLYFQLPPVEEINRSELEARNLVDDALPDAVAAKLQGAAHPDTVLPLADGRDALAARIALIRAARRSIDAQYYIWSDDTTGRILLEELRQAAERGVRVRLLLDDNGIPGQDAVLVELDAMPSAQVRLYNPFPIRRIKPLAYLFDFRRLNHRMHNKALVVDAALTIIGGRNIGDIYFAYGEGAHFFDLDVLIGGHAATAVESNFQSFWDSRHSYPIQAIVGEREASKGLIEANAETAQKELLSSRYLEGLQGDFTDVVATLFAQGENAAVALVSDTPGKALDGEELRMLESVAGRIGAAQTSADIISPYFIPGERGSELLRNLSNSGAAIRVITNSLSSTDVPMVHGAYARYRYGLLASGVELFELRPSPTGETRIDWKHNFRSSAGLHGKAFALDGQTVFVGSFNLDPRSARLNTEMGVYVESERMAELVGEVFERSALLWSVKLDDDQELAWTMDECREDCADLTSEPEAGFWRKANAALARYLHLDGML